MGVCFCGFGLGWRIRRRVVGDRVPGVGVREGGGQAGLCRL